MTLLVQQLVNGLALGTTYSLIALGFVLVFGVLRVLNVAHGDVVILGAYAGLIAGSAMGNSFVVAVVAAVIAGAIVGWLLERIAVRPVAGSELAPFLTTLGAAIVIQGVLRTVYTAQPRAYPITVATGSLEVGGVVFGKAQLLVLAIAAALLFLLDWAVHRTQLGRNMRAIAEDSAMASSLGINAQRLRTWTLVFASALGGFTGVLLAGIYGIVTPTLGIGLGLKGLIILIVGGLGSFRGAIAVGIVLGLAEVLVAAFVSSELRDVVAFLLLVLILLVRPTGLFGKRRMALAAGGDW